MGQNNFALLIVEYVDVKELTIRETYFISHCTNLMTKSVFIKD